MTIGIIGAGFTGLSAAYKLAKLGNKVVIFEKDSRPGGLAVGFKEEDWAWSLEKHYHHLFASDRFALQLAKEIGQPLTEARPKTSVYIDNTSFQLDSPFHVLTFPKLPFFERLRMAISLGLFFRYNPFWQPLEKLRITEVLPKIIGKHAYQKLWEPQLRKKFGEYSDDINLAWFWSRIKVRTPNLFYPEGGFLNFSEKLANTVTSMGGEIFFNSEVSRIISEKGNVFVSVKKLNTKTLETLQFDKIVVTLPSFLFMKITPQLPDVYVTKMKKLHGIGALNLVLRLKRQFLHDGTYWLSICDKTSPVMAVVEHTNFISKKHYNNEHLVYVGNYLPAGHPYFNLSREKLLQTYDPFLKRINPDYKRSIIDYDLFSTPFAQSIIYPNYSKLLPEYKTPLNQIYLANIQQVYPWDRGTNYAIELGQKIVDIMLSDEPQ